MSSELSEDQERTIDALVKEGSFRSRREALDRAVELLRLESETMTDLREGIASMERGEGVPLEDVVRFMRKKYRIPEDA